MNLFHHAKELHTKQATAQRFLWRHLRNRQLQGYKFRRQITLPPYIADFVCLEAKLIVEIDGSHYPQQLDYDKERSRYLQAQGFEVLRFWNDEVLKNTAAVLEVILRRLQDIPSPPGASSTNGEGVTQTDAD